MLSFLSCSHNYQMCLVIIHLQLISSEVVSYGVVRLTDLLGELHGVCARDSVGGLFLKSASFFS